jgi:hypothetical protein
MFPVFRISVDIQKGHACVVIIFTIQENFRGRKRFCCCYQMYPVPYRPTVIFIEPFNVSGAEFLPWTAPFLINSILLILQDWSLYTVQSFNELERSIIWQRFQWLRQTEISANSKVLSGRPQYHLACLHIRLLFFLNRAWNTQNMFIPWSIAMFRGRFYKLAEAY